jgi:anti-sigma-K factor RskA
LNIEEYISSGIIENYVLGLTSPEENLEVEEMSARHPEVARAIEAYRHTMDAYSSLHAVKPPEQLKARIIDAIRTENSNPPQESATLMSNNTKENAAVILLRKWKRWAIAATILLIVSLVFNGIYIGKYQKSRDSYTTLLQSQQRLAAQNNTMEARLVKVEKNMQVLMNPAMKSVVMEGVNNHPGMLATIYWDAESRQTYLGTTNLPVPPKGMAYQLWAIVDGKPVDMGMYNPADQKGLLSMKDVIPGKIQAFAITLEKQGGSPAPTMDQMYVMGKI